MANENNGRKCRFHPEQEARVFCNKHEYGYCEECLETCSACSDPDLYCRHRTYCVIWELCRKTVRKRKGSAANGQGVVDERKSEAGPASNDIQEHPPGHS